MIPDYILHPEPGMCVQTKRRTRKVLAVDGGHVMYSQVGLPDRDVTVTSWIRLVQHGTLVDEEVYDLAEKRAKYRQAEDALIRRFEQQYPRHGGGC